MTGGSTCVRGADTDWNNFMEKLETAEVEFANGRPEEFKALWSHADDVTLSGGLGGAIEVGWDKVAARLDWVSPKYADGKRSRQEFSGYVGDDFAYLVQKEFIEARVGSQTERRGCLGVHRLQADCGRAGLAVSGVERPDGAGL